MTRKLLIALKPWLSPYKWYRKYIGGKWYKVYDHSADMGLAGGYTLWVTKVFDDLEVLDEENYTY